MRANTQLTATESMPETQHPSMLAAIDSAAIQVADFTLRLLSAYLVYGFGLPRENFEFVKEN